MRGRRDPQVTMLAQPLERDFWEPVGRSTDLQVRLATEEDIEALCALRPQLSAQTISSRLADGQDCYLAVVGGALAFAYWIRTEIADIDHLHLVLTLKKEELYMYEVFTNPAYRHLQVGRPVREARERRYAARGFRLQLGYSVPGFKPFGRNDPLRVATIRTLRLGPLRKFWVKAYGPQAEYWRERLKELRWA